MNLIYSNWNDEEKGTNIVYLSSKNLEYLGLKRPEKKDGYFIYLKGCHIDDGWGFIYVTLLGRETSNKLKLGVNRFPLSMRKNFVRLPAT